MTTPTEKRKHDAAKEYTAEAGERNLSGFESGDVVAHIWMEDEKVTSIGWCSDD